MNKLTPLEFKVTNFRNIDDSGWIPMERVTALVGRNESGKTALLKALHEFNAASQEPFFRRDGKQISPGNWPPSGLQVRRVTSRKMYSTERPRSSKKSIGGSQSSIQRRRLE